jgi:hypothetical protein
MMTEQTEDSVLLIEVPAKEQIQPGDWVERRWGDGYRREYKAKKGKNGLAVRHQSGKYWYTDDLPLPEFHRLWRKVTMSPAVRLVELLAEKMREESVQARPGLIRKAIELAVEAQMRFDLDDFSKIHREYPYHDESAYRFVVESGNASALAALEKYIKRDPFLYDALDEAGKKRLYVGASFKWDGLFVKVTSIKDKNNLIACHQQYDQETRETKTLRIFRISRDDLARFTWLRGQVLRVGGWVHEQRPSSQFKLSYLHKPTGEYVCYECRAADADRSWFDYSLTEIAVLEAGCSRCHTMLYTKPPKEERERALKQAEALSAEQPVNEAELARWLFHALPLCKEYELAYMERIAATGQRAGILSPEQAGEAAQ